MTSPASTGRIRRLHPFIVTIAFLSTYYVALLGPILPAIAEPLGGSAFAIGLLFSAYSLAQFLTAPTLGALEDRYGRRVIFTIGAQSGAGLWVLLLGWVIVGASDCWLTTAFSSVADATTPDVRTRFFAFLTAAIGTAFIVGPATSGVFSAAGPTTPLFALLGLLVAATAWGWFSMPESLPPSRRATALERSHFNPLSQIRDIMSFPQLRVLLRSGTSWTAPWPCTASGPASSTSRHSRPRR